MRIPDIFRRLVMGDTGLWAARLRCGAVGASALIALLALLGLVGWVADIPELTTLGADSRPMMPSGVFMLMLFALGLRMLGSERAGELRWPVRGVGTLALLLAALGIGLEMGWLPEPGTGALALLSELESRPTSAGTACCYGLLAAGMVLATLKGQRAWEWSQFFAVAVAGVALVALVGLTFRLVRLDLAVPSLGMALPVALGLAAGSFGLMVTRPSSRLMQLLEHDSPGAVIVRRLVPLAVCLPLLAGWLQALGQRVGWFENVESEGALTVAVIVACLTLILWTSSRLDEMNQSRSLAERREATQRQWLDATLANIGDAVLTVNDECRVSFLNPAAEALLEAKAAAAVGRDVGELLTLVDEATGEPLGGPLRTAFSRGVSLSLDGEPAVRRRDGSLQAVEVTSTPIRDHRDRLMGGVMVLRDVSTNRARAHAEREAYAALDRRVAERTRALDRTMTVLRESTTLLRTIAASTPELIVAKGRDGRIMMVNPAALQVMGLSQAQVIGRSEADIFGDDGETAVSAANDRRVIETGRPAVVEEHRTIGGISRTFLVTKSPLRDEDGVVFGLVGVAKDITDRKRAQLELEQLLVAEHKLRGDAERANRAKDEFLAIVSHELRSPLNALKGWSQILSSAKTLDTGLVGRAADAIKRNIDHQTRLIDDLLDTSRIISGKLDLNLYRVNLVDVVGVALDLSREPAAAKQIELRFDCDYAVVPVEGDFDRLQQIVSNLLSNAIKFTPEAGLIEVSLKQQEEHVELSVADNGIGIEPDFLPHVFDRFSQADTSMTRRYLGLGIGLALVRNLVELHGGSVRAASAGAKQGAVFTVVLPRARSGASVKGANPEGPGPEARVLDGVVAYVVDDEDDAREVMRLMLSNAGAQVRTFESGEALLEIWGTTTLLPMPAVLVLDIAMPGASGFEVLREIRKMDHLPQVPAIACTAFTHLGEDCFAEAGFQSRLGKPVEEDRLIDTVLDVLGRREAAGTSVLVSTTQALAREA